MEFYDHRSPEMLPVNQGQVLSDAKVRYRLRKKKKKTQDDQLANSQKKIKDISDTQNYVCFFRPSSSGCYFRIVSRHYFV